MRSRLLLLVLLPTLAAVILAGGSVFSSVRSALAYQRVEQLSRLGGEITGLVQALQSERENTISYITMGAKGGGRGASDRQAAPELAVLAQDYRASDRLAGQVRSLAGTIGASYPAVAQQEAQRAITALDGLRALRGAATGSHLPSLVVIRQYATIINQLLALEGEIATGSNDASLADTVRALGLISGTKEEVSQEQAILTSALTPDLVGATQFEPGQLAAINAAQAEQQADLAQFGLTATAGQRQLYENALSSAQADRAQAQVQQAITVALTGGSSAEDPAFTNAANGSQYLVASLHGVEQGFMSSIIGQTGSLRDDAIRSALIDGAAVVLILALALLFTIAVGRSMTRPLRRLRAGALEVAGMRLPETVRWMSEGEGAGVPLAVAPIAVDSADEIGEVARAFDQVHREAVRLAANEAALRGNVNAMFVNLSRRSQSLVERQIRLIDDLEQGEQDPERLANLFQMDHLATRMRRNSENLLVLAGHDLSKRWTEPVPLVDVLRAAVSEIEHYERVVPSIQPGISVRGPAVSDVVHLLSELAENATSFSADQTPVHVSGHLLGSGGVLLDITDRGVGMDAEEMAHANWRLDNPPVVDVAVSRRMGLFVVARLAARHGIRVRLRPAPMGGLTALVWLPDEVITRETPASGMPHRRFQPAMPGVTAGLLGTGLTANGADGHAAGEAAADTAAATAVSAAWTSRFGPIPPQTGDVPPEFGAEPEPSEPEPAGPEPTGRPELTSGPDRPAGPEIPAGPDFVSWPEFGARPDAAVIPAAAPGPGPASSPEFPAEQHFTQVDAAPATAARTVVLPPPASTGEENRLPIFESVESDWFRRGRLPAERSVPVRSSAPGGDWASPADEGWRAAEVTQSPVSAGTTGAGLPKRVPKANLVPGGVGAPPAPRLTQARSAAQTRERLSSFQRGIREARAAAPGDEAPGSGETDVLT